MNVWKQKLAVSLVALSALLVPVVAFAANNTYDIQYNFDSNLTGTTRTFGGSNIAVDLNSNYNGTDKSNYFSVDLFRHHTFSSDDFISTGTAPSIGTKTIQWGGVGAGDFKEGESIC
ncbi:hypothetical protein [Tumebacillus permanentifrigoris]|nr:hypothetical protein [Tumebacillus permanentifrigoris]